MLQSNCEGIKVPGKCPGNSSYKCCMFYISNLKEDFDHFLKETGDNAKASSKLIEEMKSNTSYRSMIIELINIIKNKINEEAFRNGDTITAAENSYRTFYYQT